MRCFLISSRWTGEAARELLRFGNQLHQQDCWVYTTEGSDFASPWGGFGGGTLLLGPHKGLRVSQSFVVLQ